MELRKESRVWATAGGSMSKFKVGDKVRVVELLSLDEGSGLKVGDVVTVTRPGVSSHSSDIWVNHGAPGHFCSTPDGYEMTVEQLELVEDGREEEQKRPTFKAGDRVRYIGGVKEGDRTEGYAISPGGAEVGEVEHIGGCPPIGVDFPSQRGTTRNRHGLWHFEEEELELVEAHEAPKRQADPILTVLPAGSVACYPGTCADCEHFKEKVVGVDCLAIILEEGVLGR